MFLYSYRVKIMFKYLLSLTMIICLVGEIESTVELDDNGNRHNSSRFARSPAALIQSQKKLIDEESCPQLRTLCSNLIAGTDDLYVLECIQTFQSNHIDRIPDECQHTIWSHITNLIDNRNMFTLLQRHCFNDGGEKSSICEVSPEHGTYLACILDHKDEFKNPGCCDFIKRIEWVAFSDFRLIGTFVRDCEEDIETFGCGRLTADRNKLSQGKTLACLQDKIDQLTLKCKKGVYHLSELQSDSIVLDRQLYLACGTDVIQFCSNVREGSGAVYKCLTRNKNDVNMSKKCQEQLFRRNKLIAHDYKVSRLGRACKEDIRLNHCRRGVSDDKDVKLAQILLCLEAVQKNTTKISSDCLAEMHDHRKLLMEDYRLSPEILTDCANDIINYCNNLDAGGQTIHCLMERAKRKKDRVSAPCQRAIEMLSKVADVGEDWRVDPILRRDCKPVVDLGCREIEGGDARVMSCLMEKLGTKFMTEDCETALLQIQYFVARDFKLDPQLYRHCKYDAIRYCKAKNTWADLDTAQMDPERGPMILPCLHYYVYHSESKQLKSGCVQEVKRVMRQRAISVDLIPEVEDKCLNDLATFCFDKTGKGDEMQCLQDNLDKLEDGCKKAVSQYTEEEAEHIELNPILTAVCGGAIDKFCGNILKTGKDEGEIMDCLISHKNDDDLRSDAKCRAEIEHFQLISIKNYHFTYKFKEACRNHVVRHCPQSNTKYDVIACLSEVMRNDTIMGSSHKVSKECRQQVRAQLFQQRENIDFDPRLKAACNEDIRKFCKDITSGAGQVLECLQNNHDLVNVKCRHALFQVKRSEFGDTGTDYALLNTCKDMLKQYCRESKSSQALSCLKIHKDEPLFDRNCHLIIVNRMIEQNLDYRFNPDLQQACSRNIADFCTTVVASAKENEELNGKVINCLKNKFREGKLSSACEKQMTEVLHEQALNYKLNPLLKSVCKKEIDVLCYSAKSFSLDNNDLEDHGEVEECLKTLFLQKKIIANECKLEVAQLIEQTKADIHVDPLLQRACTVDLLKYCSNVQSGNGKQLKCLEVILEDESKALEDDCKKKLLQRIEMFKNSANLIPQAENLSQLYTEVVTSPAKRYFLLVLLTFVGFVFIFGLFCGRVTRRTIAMKNK